MLESYAPVGVVINSAMEVIEFRGRTTPYLEPAPGKASLNVLKLARNGLAVELRTLIDAASKKGMPVRKDEVRFNVNGQKRILNLSVLPLGEKDSEDQLFFVVLFDDVTSQSIPTVDVSRSREKGSAGDRSESKRLKRELADTQDALRSAIESEDSLREEFQSANEEILSANEELQSTNEELETSKEELQSTNEELSTLNAELRQKNDDLHELGNHISNLLNSTRIPVVMLDRGSRIRRITPRATKLLKVVPSDIGRPIADIRLNVDAPGMESMIARVLENLQPAESEVQDLEGRWHSLSVLPYRTEDEKIDGVVLALHDIDAMKVANEQLRKSTAFFRGVMNTVIEPLLVLDAELRVIMANEAFLKSFQVSADRTVNKFIYDLGNGQWNIAKLRVLLEEVLPRHKTIHDFMVEHDFESIGPRRIVLNAQTLISAHDEQPMILLAFEDITERTQAEAALRESGERFRTLFNLVPVAVYYCDVSGVIQNFNHRAEELWGRSPEPGDTDERFCGSFKMFRPDATFMPHEDCPMAEVVSGKIQEIHDQEVLIERPDGSQITVIVNIRPLRNQLGEVTGAVNCFYDISDRKLAEAALIKSEKLAAAGRLAATLAHEINNPLQAVTNLVTLLKQSPKLDTQDRSFAALAAEELDRVAHLTQQSLSFYRESSHPTSVNLEIVFDSVLDLYAKRLLAKEIIVTKDYALDGATIDSYPGEIRQVLSTLLLNAIEAVPAGGTIALRIRRSFDGNNRVSNGVRMTIADTGIEFPRITPPASLSLFLQQRESKEQVLAYG